MEAGEQRLFWAGNGGTLEVHLYKAKSASQCNTMQCERGETTLHLDKAEKGVLMQCKPMQRKQGNPPVSTLSMLKKASQCNAMQYNAMQCNAMQREQRTLHCSLTRVKSIRDAALNFTIARHLLLAKTIQQSSNLR